MKKKVFAILLAALLLTALSATAFAEDISGAGGWYVEYNSKGKIESNFSSGAIADTLSNVQPGDTTTIQVAVRNTSDETVEWYMMNNILNSLEDTSSGTSGGYTYILTYATSGGETRELYSSNRVGGDQTYSTSSAGEGLNEIEDALKDYMFLERMTSGGAGMLTLQVALEPESHDNAFQISTADLQLRFAVEPVGTEYVVVTGDTPVQLSPVYIAMAISGLIVLLLAVDGVARNARKNRREPKA